MLRLISRRGCPRTFAAASVVLALCGWLTSLQAADGKDAEHPPHADLAGVAVHRGLGEMRTEACMGKAFAELAGRDRYGRS